MRSGSVPPSRLIDPDPVCLPCWRDTLGHMNDDPPRVEGWPEETCQICKRQTNYGIYVELGDEE